MMGNKYSVSRRTLMTGTALIASALPFAGVAADSPELAPDLSGVSILITGTSSGFGRLGAEYYARLGATVFASMRNTPRSEAAELTNLAANENLDIRVLEIDVLSDEQVQAGIDQVLAATGGTLDVLINNAGIGITGPVEVQDLEATKLAFDTNVFGCQRMARAVLPAMREAGRGLIVPISSQIGRLVVPGGGHYPATKFALEAMSEQMAYELAAFGVDVSIIEPGGYPTKIWVNRNRYTGALKDRTSTETINAYGPLAAGMGQEDGSGRSTDPMDVPRAIARLIAQPPGTRALRTAVHPAYRPQESVNAATAKAQLAFLGETRFGPAIKSVLNR